MERYMYIEKYANTPLALAGTKRIEVGYGTFPRRAMEGRCLLTGVCAVACWCFTHPCSERDGFRCQNVAKTHSEQPKGNQKRTKMEPKRAKEPSKTPLRNRVKKMSKNVPKQSNTGVSIWSKINTTQQKHHPRKAFTNLSRNSLKHASKTMPKGSQES